MNWWLFAFFYVLPMTLLGIWLVTPELALKHVNDARIACGKEPRSQLALGRRNQPNCCPLATSLPGAASVHYTSVVWSQIPKKKRKRLIAAWDTSDKPYSYSGVQLRQHVSTSLFALLFDWGLYPQFRT